jgi:asparagine synthetase B (glutamine-hydrolysing)
LVLEFKDLFSDAIKLRLRSDVVGTSLSGGLDSSAISAIASAEYTKKIERKVYCYQC